MSISAQRDCGGLTGPKSGVESAHASPGPKYEGIPPGRISELVIYFGKASSHLTKSRERIFSMTELALVWTGRRCWDENGFTPDTVQKQPRSDEGDTNTRPPLSSISKQRTN